MRFWQLQSIAREQPELLLEIASQKPIWQEYARSASDFGTLVSEQRRDILDKVVDIEFRDAVLSRMSQVLHLDNGQLRSYSTPSSQEITALEAVTRYGATSVEDTFEFGSVTV